MHILLLFIFHFANHFHISLLLDVLLNRFHWLNNISSFCYGGITSTTLLSGILSSCHYIPIFFFWFGKYPWLEISFKKIFTPFTVFLAISYSLSLSSVYCQSLCQLCSLFMFPMNPSLFDVGFPLAAVVSLQGCQFIHKYPNCLHFKGWKILSHSFQPV